MNVPWRTTTSRLLRKAPPPPIKPMMCGLKEERWLNTANDEKKSEHCAASFRLSSTRCPITSRQDASYADPHVGGSFWRKGCDRDWSENYLLAHVFYRQFKPQMTIWPGDAWWCSLSPLLFLLNRPFNCLIFCPQIAPVTWQLNSHSASSSQSAWLV